MCEFLELALEPDTKSGLNFLTPLIKAMCCNNNSADWGLRWQEAHKLAFALTKFFNLLTPASSLWGRGEGRCFLRSVDTVVS